MKCIATINPSDYPNNHSTEGKIYNLVGAGADTFCIDYGYIGAHEAGETYINEIRKVAKELGQTLTIIQELGGPECRIGEMVGRYSGVQIATGNHLTITNTDIVGYTSTISTNHKSIYKKLYVGEPISINYGEIQTRVVKIDPDKEEVVLEVINGGFIKENMKINLPSSELTYSFLTDKDIKDLESGLSNNVDWVACSIDSINSIKYIKNCITTSNNNTKLISKIGSDYSIYHLDEIIKASDAIMVDRNKLAINRDYAEMPYLQGLITYKCLSANKTVIVDGQMLQSMVHQPIATAAECNDIYSTILSGAAIKLGDVTARGKYPTQAMSQLKSIFKTVEEHKAK